MTAAVSIVIEPQDRRITFTNTYGTSEWVDYDHEMITEQRRALRNDLEGAKECLRAGPSTVLPSWLSVSRAVRLLHSRGRKLAFQILGPKKAPRIQQLFIEACPNWRGKIPGAPLPIVEVVGSLKDHVPLEYVPMFDFEVAGERGVCTCVDDLVGAMQPFLGVSTVVVRRLSRNSVAQGSQLECASCLPVKLFYHSSLRYIDEELGALHNGLIDLDGPWPDDTVVVDDFAAELMSHLLSREIGFNGSPRVMDQIHHLACHCESNVEDSEKGFVELKGPTTPRLQASLGSLQEAVMRSGKTIAPEATGPLVFLNACGTSYVVPGGTASFVNLFSKIGSRGVIGTEANVPDKAAARFAIRFYQKLLETGETLGSAFHAAQGSLLRDYRNPLGIAYVLYADPLTKLLRRA